MKKLTTYQLIAFVIFLFLGCNDCTTHHSSDDVVVEGLRGLYPGGSDFCDYKSKVVERGQGIIPELITASKDADPQMRESVARCLGSIGTDDAVSRLIEMADDDKIEETVWIALSYSKSSKAIPKLVEELESHSTLKHRGRLLIALAECGDKTRLNQLLDVMKTTTYPGHIYGANEAFEKVAGKRFYKNTDKIEKWLMEEQQKSL